MNHPGEKPIPSGDPPQFGPQLCPLACNACFPVCLQSRFVPLRCTAARSRQESLLQKALVKARKSPANDSSPAGRHEIWCRSD